MWWYNNRDIDIEYDEDDEENNRKMNIVMPILVGVIVWLCAYMYFGNNNTEKKLNNWTETSSDSGLDLDTIDIKQSYNLMGKGINIPKNLPDVFIEMI